MPGITINTNVKLSAEQHEALLKRLSKSVSEAVAKPEEFIMIGINDGCALMFGGSTEPCAMCDSASIGKIDLEHNTKVSAVLADALHAICGISKDRYYCSFTDFTRENMGFHGATVANPPTA